MWAKTAYGIISQRYAEKKARPHRASMVGLRSPDEKSTMQLIFCFLMQKSADSQTGLYISSFWYIMWAALTQPLSTDMALCTSAGVDMTTKPKPQDLPLMRSRTTSARCTVPWALKSCWRDASFTLHGRLPMYSLFEGMLELRSSKAPGILFLPITTLGEWPLWPPLTRSILTHLSWNLYKRESFHQLSKMLVCRSRNRNYIYTPRA